jgi:hypothetical protein
MKNLTIRWQRLINETGQTCERCTDTGDKVEAAFNKLKKSLSELDIKVELIKETLDFSIFIKDPLQSNRIWIGDKPLEKWLDASVGKSQCCEVCDLIVRAGLLAAAELLKNNSTKKSS